MQNEKTPDMAGVTVQDDSRMALAERIRSVMASGSARSFAAQIGVAHTTLNKYLSGETEPSFSVLLKIADVSGCSVEWLMRGVDSAQLADREIDIIKSINEHNVEIPYFDVKASAGTGNMIFSEAKKSILSVPRKIIGLREDYVYYLIAFNIVGDSMEPTISDGELVICMICDGSIDRDGVYALNINDELFVKRVTREAGINGNSWRISSDNANYQAMHLSEHQKESVRAIGRVIWPPTRRH